MRRDFELVRRLAKEIADAPPGCPAFSLSLPGEYDDKVVWAHIDMMIDAGLVSGRVLRGMNEGICAVLIRGLTWEGHNFLEAASSPTIWQKAFSVVAEKGGAMTFDVLKALLSKLALEIVGIKS
ncbi:MAG: DUF2513 domain-containing protein [Burkholderiales bacterium]|jgi:hypothetical protein|nr:DUF2513 domain-containing protein [Burkholderiales bacterium]